MKKNEYFLKGIQNTDKKVFIDIYKMFFPKVLKFVLNNKGQKEDAEDVFQKVLLQFSARMKVKEFTISSTFEGYIFTACKNLWRRELNKNKKRVTTDKDLEPIYDATEMSVSILEQERWEIYKEKFELLSDNCKEVLKMFFEKTAYSTIVKLLGYSSETVARQRVFKCKAKLTEMIKSDSRYKGLQTI